MAAIYYIDSENVGNNWIWLLDDSDSRFIVFYTGHSPSMTYPQVTQLLNAANEPEFIECYEGSNGLDFQLVTYLGYEIHADNSNEMIIVSNDTGFDAAVLFWKDRGINIKRVPCSNASISQPIEKNIPVSDDKIITVLSSVEEVEKIDEAVKKELYTIVNCIGARELVYIHQTFKCFYGINGENYYKFLKKEQFAVPAVQWRKKTRMKKLIELIIEYTHSTVPVPDSLPGFIIDNIVDDKKYMAKIINEVYIDFGPQLYRMFKPFIKILVKIKEE